MSDLQAAVSAFLTTFVVGASLNVLIQRWRPPAERKLFLLEGIVPSAIVALFVYYSR
jgi:hypothetical protein